MDRTEKEKFIATLIGGALGDSLGMPVEGWKKQQIERYIGKITKQIAPVIIYDEKRNRLEEDVDGKMKYWTADLNKGEYTDDTILTLAIAESIVEKGCLDLQDIALRQVEAYKKCKQGDGHVRGGFGQTTRDAFEKIIAGVDYSVSGVHPGMGNGPCMKMAPVGLQMFLSGEYKRGIHAAELIGKSTHLDERAIASGVMQAHAIYTLLSESSREEFIESMYNTCRRNEKANPCGFPLEERGCLAERFKWIKDNRDADPDRAYGHIKNSALAFESYPFAVFMFQKFWNEPIPGLLATVNYGGDCDTTGSIYGALAGTKDGMIFPEGWIKVLNNSDYIIKLGGKLADVPKNSCDL